MIVIYDQARARAYSPEYTAYRDRVISSNGSIASASAAQAALDLLALTSSIVQWLDARFGVRPIQEAARWYCLRGQDGVGTAYGGPLLGTDALLGQAVWRRGAWAAGVTPDLALGDSYTWGMRYYQANQQVDGFFWGERSNTAGSLGFFSWYSSAGWRCYNNGDDRDIPVSLPLDTWGWVWVVKDGPTVTGYDEANRVLFTTTLTSAMLQLSLGVGGGTDSVGVSDRLRYQSFVRASSALTPTQRAAIQAI